MYYITLFKLENTVSSTDFNKKKKKKKAKKRDTKKLGPRGLHLKN